MLRTFIAFTVVGMSGVGLAGGAEFPPAATQPILPPGIPWSGKSRALVVDRSDPWITPCEASDFRFSPGYDDTVAWLRKLVESSPELKMLSLGQSPDGRDIWMVVASKERAFTPSELRATGKPTFLAQAGIHSGEIDGKDAGMMLLRDIAARKTKSDLLDGANFLFVPIFSVDAHENASAYHRSNQRGPEITGWRTTSRNLNLNRDYAKVDSAEMRAMVRALNEWSPDLYYDIHVTDGADYQYDITWGCNGEHAHSPQSARWMRQVLTPAVENDLRNAGHIPGMLVFASDPVEFRKGLREMTAEPRYSHGYGDARHVPSILVENHALKPYDQRVLGTYVLLEATLRELARSGKDLRSAVERDRAARPDEVPLAFGTSDEPAQVIDFLGIDYRTEPSEITGATVTRWLGKPLSMRIPYVRTSKPTVTVKRPKAYWIPPSRTDVIERLKLHGIAVESIAEPREIDVTMYRIENPKLAAEPFEGHVT
ncbi:MAG: M14 family metallopeptidase, partial [Tepidisphaeraceae bacterium]